MKRLPVFFAIIYSFLLPLTIQAEIITFMHTVKQPFGGSQSPDDARIAAIAKAKREVLERAGTYLESLTIVEEAVLTKDRVLALASGILKAEIVSQENYVTKDGFGIIVKARIQVDTSLLEERVKKLMADRTAVEQLVAMSKREEELLDKIKILEEKNRVLAKKVDTQATKEEKKALAQKFKQASGGLNAISLRYDALVFLRYGGHNNYKKALEILNKAIELDPNHAMAYIHQGIAYTKLKEHTKAIQTYSKAIELNPNLETSYILRGSEYTYLKNYTKAIQDYNKAIELNPNDVNFYKFRGWAYRELNQHTKAIQDFSKVVDMDPNDERVYYSRGVEYNYLKEWTKAIEDFSKAIELNPNDMKAYYKRGAAYALLKQHRKAIQDYSKAIEMDPNLAKAYLFRGFSFISMGLTDKACADFKKACDLGVCRGWQWARGKGYCF